MGSKDAPQKMMFLGGINKVASLGAFMQTQKWRKNPKDSAVIEAKYVRITMLLHIPRAHGQRQICICGFMSKI